MTSDFIIRILVAGLLGGLVGLERELRAKEAGVRTHFLVALGSGLLMVLSQYAFSGRFDSARVAAQVVSGMGFIGAGTIIFQRNAVRGLTTAAGIWVAAAIGLTCGAGMYVLAGAATAMVITVLELMHFLLHRDRNITVTWSAGSRAALLDSLEVLHTRGLAVVSYSIHTGKHSRPSEKGGGEMALPSGAEDSASRERYTVTAELKVHAGGPARTISLLLDTLADVRVESIVG